MTENFSGENSTLFLELIGSILIIVLFMLSMGMITAESARAEEGLTFAVVIQETIAEEPADEHRAEMEIEEFLAGEGFGVHDAFILEDYRDAEGIEELRESVDKVTELGQEMDVDIMIYGDARAEVTREREGRIDYEAVFSARAVEIETQRIIHTGNYETTGDGATDMTALHGAVQRAAANWTIDLISLSPPERYDILVPRFAFGEEVEEEILSDVVEGELAQMVERRVHEEFAGDEVDVDFLLPGEERVEAYERMGDAHVMVMGDINEFDIEKIDDVGGIGVEHYVLEFTADISWRVRTETRDAAALGNESGTLEFESTFAGFGDGPDFEELMEEDEVEQVLDYIVDEISEDVQNTVLEQRERDKQRYSDSALEEQYAVGDGEEEIEFEITTVDGDVFSTELNDVISFDAGITVIEMEGENLESLVRENGDWNLTTREGDVYSGEPVDDDIQVVLAGETTLVSLAEIDKILRKE